MDSLASKKAPAGSVRIMRSPALEQAPKITSQALWAKLERDDVGRVVRWHSLVDHSADVAAVVEALLYQPTLRRRLAATAGWPDLDEVTIARLAGLSFLHDIGKANRGFRARIDPRAELVGHI